MTRNPEFPAGNTVSVLVTNLNPDATGGNVNVDVPVFHSIASEVGPDSPQGVIIFAGEPGVNLEGNQYGVVIWYNS